MTRPQPARGGAAALAPLALALLALAPAPFAGVARADEGCEEPPGDPVIVGDGADPVCEEDGEEHGPDTDEGGGDAPAGGDGKPADPAAKPDEEGEGKGARWFAVHAGELHTGARQVLRDVTVLARDGRIVAIDHDVALPPGTEVLDARGLRAYPGLVAFEASGLVGAAPEDSTDVYALDLQLALSGGVTTVAQGTTVAKLTWGSLDGHLVAKDAYLRLDGSSRGLRSLRDELERLRAYQRKKRALDLDRARGLPPAPEPDRRWISGRLAQLERLLQGQTRGVLAASDRAALTAIATLALDYQVRLVVVGAEEAWTVADLLGRAGVACVVVSRSRRDEDARRAQDTGWTIENAARLHARGVPVALVPGSRGVSLGGLGGRDLMTLNLEAAFAVRGGLSEQDALAAITLVPARLLGVDDRVGSVEVGKDMDLAITRGDLLRYTTLVEYTVVHGRVAYDKAKEPLLRAVRSRNHDGQTVPIPQLWPRRVGEPEPELPPAER